MHSHVTPVSFTALLQFIWTFAKQLKAAFEACRRELHGGDTDDNDNLDASFIAPTTADLSEVSDLFAASWVRSATWHVHRLLTSSVAFAHGLGTRCRTAALCWLSSRLWPLSTTPSLVS
jgi:hypothetical protein